MDGIDHRGDRPGTDNNFLSRMITTDDCLKRFGDPNKDFERDNMVLWAVPDPVRVRIPTLPERIYCNKLMVQPLSLAFENLILNCCEHELKSWRGCFDPGKLIGEVGLHSWGIAFYINSGNQDSIKPVLSRAFVRCFTEAGFDFEVSWKRFDGFRFKLSDLP